MANNFIVLLLRIVLLYLMYSVCRLFFYLYNTDIIGALNWSDFGSVWWGSFVFDSASIFYTNILFIVLSLLPFYFREKRGYRISLMWLFLITNAVALFINIADIFYYPYKLARIASDDLHYFAEDTATSLFFSFMAEYWQGTLLLVGILLTLYIVGFVVIRPRIGVRFILFKPLFYFVNLFLLAGSVGFAIFAIRGYTAGKDSFPVNVSDAAMYVRPNLSSLILSNPFSFIRTYGNDFRPVEYMPSMDVKALFSPIHMPVDSAAIHLEDKTNIILIVLESFGSAHIKSLNSTFDSGRKSYTPFLDSLFAEGMLFTNAYQNGIRSIDAMPAIWGSIPSYDQNFMSLPQSQAKYEAMPYALSQMGYKSYFFHGAARSSMSFVAFGQMAGVNKFVSREDYTAKHGNVDFDGKWGIWDHKFLPFVSSELRDIPQPFFATIFTLSSHEPFKLPKGFEGRYPEGTMDIHRMISYTDEALSQFFNDAKKQGWYDNTLFIITADHASGADNTKYHSAPYNHSIPIFFFAPGSSALKGRNDKIVSHIDIAPTLLAMLGYSKPYFAFGSDIFNSTEPPFSVNYYNNTFGVVTDSLFYQLSADDLLGVYNYKTDYEQKNNLLHSGKEYNTKRFKASIQSYYERVGARSFTTDNRDQQ